MIRSLIDILSLAWQRTRNRAGAGSKEGVRRKGGSGDEDRTEASAGDVTWQALVSCFLRPCAKLQ